MRSLRVSTLGRAIADPSRAEILCLLSSGTPRTAGQLAAHVGLAASTTSSHLSELVDANLLTVEASGRHRYFRLRSPDVRDLLTLIDRMDLPTPDVARRRSKPTLATARTCYDHLAGEVGVALYRAILAQGLLDTPDDLVPRLSEDGRTLFQRLGLDTEWLEAQRRPLARGCLDWEAQAQHLGGGLGGALLTMMLERGWLTQQSDRRVVVVTKTGERQLKQIFGLELTAS